MVHFIGMTVTPQVVDIDYYDRLTRAEIMLQRLKHNQAPTVPEYGLGGGSAPPPPPTVVAVIAGQGGGSRVGYLLSDLTFHIATDPTYASNFGYSVAYNSDISTWVVVCDNNFLLSSDGITWTSITCPFGATASGSDVVSHTGSTIKFIASCPGNATVDEGIGYPATLASSQDGITWTLRVSVWDETFGFVNGLFAAGVPSSNAIYAAGGDGNGVYVLEVSFNISLTWDTVDTTPAVSNQLYRGCYSSDLGLAVAVGPAGDGNGVYSSTNGSTWTPRRVGGVWQDVCRSDSANMFVAVANGTSNSILTSPDGITWTLVNHGSNGGVTWSPTLGLFITTSGTNIYTSPDGTTWADLGNVGFTGARLLGV